MGYKPNPDTQLPAFTTVTSLTGFETHTRIRFEHRPQPMIDNLLVRVRAMTEDAEDLWEVLQAQAAQTIMSVEARWDPHERLLFIFGGKEVAGRIFRQGVDDRYWAGRPVSFQLSNLRGDTEVRNTFQAWARSTGYVTTQAFFGNNILQDENVRKARLSSVRVRLNDATQDIVVFISADGRINCSDDSLDHNALYDLFQRLHVKLTPNRRLDDGGSSDVTNDGQ